MFKNNRLKRTLSMILVCLLIVTGVNWPEIKVKASTTPAWDFSYTGDVQTFIAEYTGTYRLEAWGASGGDGRIENTENIFKNSGGRGGYSSGEIYLEKGEIIQVYVGGKGEDQSSIAPEAFGKGGWNGGGDGGTELGEDSPEAGAGGGGATDFRIYETVESRILVAGGGGGAGSHLSSGITTIDEEIAYRSAIGGDAGGLEGTTYNDFNIPGSQTGGYRLGVGRKGFTDIKDLNNVGGSGGGGGGYYGGTWINENTEVVSNGGAGGSSYVAGYEGCDITYRAEQNYVTFTNVVMEAGAWRGHGKARVTLINSAPSIPGVIKVNNTEINPSFAMHRNNDYIISWDKSTDIQGDKIYYQVSVVTNDVETILINELEDNEYKFSPKYGEDSNLKIRIYAKDDFSEYETYSESGIIDYFYNTTPIIESFIINTDELLSKKKVAIEVSAKDIEGDDISIFYTTSGPDKNYGEWLFLENMDNTSYLKADISCPEPFVHGTKYIKIKAVDSEGLKSLEKEEFFTLTSKKPEINIVSDCSLIKYNNTTNTEEYTNSIDLEIEVKDMDLGDSVTLSYSLNNIDFLGEEEINNNLIEGTSHIYNVDISDLSSGIHTLHVKAEDLYGNITMVETTFTIFKAPVINEVTISDIDHSQTHEVFVVIDFTNNNAETSTKVEYTFNDVDWIALFNDETTGIKTGYIDLKDNYDINQSVKFRADNGLKSQITEAKTFKAINNAPILNITSDHSKTSYNNLPETEGYTSLIDLNINVQDLDLDDEVKLNYSINEGIYSNVKNINTNLIEGTSHTFKVDITGLVAGTYNLNVKAEDLYGNIVIETTTFKIHKAPIINKVIVNNINHKDTHKVPVTIDFTNENVSSNILIEYKINDGDWNILFEGEKDSSYSGTIDFSNYYKETAKIKFKINNGLQDSDETNYYTVNLNNNKPIITITSIYETEGYNNLYGTEGYTNSIDLAVDIKDIDKNDNVFLSYAINGEAYLDEKEINSNLIEGTSHTFEVDITGLVAGTYNLNVKAEDLYGNIVIETTTFKIHKAPIINKVIVNNINRKDTHKVPVTIDFTDSSIGTITTIEYNLNNEGWKELLKEKTTGIHTGYIDFTNRIDKGIQKVRFRAYNGLKYSNETIDSEFEIVTNIPISNITSIYRNEGYDTTSVNIDTYTPSIELTGTVSDLDLDDEVLVEYYLDNVKLSETTIAALENSAVNGSFTYDVNISGCISGKHTLKVVTTDKYKNTSESITTFITYKSPIFTDAKITNINHKDTHNLPISVDFKDDDNKNITIQYQLNNDTTWTNLVVNEISGEYDVTIDLKENYITTEQKIRFRALSEIQNLGTKYSKVSKDYSFTLTSNTPIVTITSDYDALGYDTTPENKTYTPSITLSGTVSDADLDDEVFVEYYLDDVKMIVTKTLTASDNSSLNDVYTFNVDISECVSGEHTLKVIVTDRYGHSSETEKVFYTYKSPKFVKANVISIDHSERHTVPIEVTFDDADSKKVTIQYQLNNDTTWTDLIINESQGTHNATIDYKINYTTETQYIRFRALSDVPGLGVKYSNVSDDYSFTLTSNTPVVNINSTYKSEGYDTFNGNKTYEPTITLSGTVTDIDLDDSVTVEYFLDNISINKDNKTILFAQDNKSLNDNYNFIIDIRGCDSGKHTLKVVVTDKYGHSSEAKKDFYTYKSPNFVEANITSIDHSERHTVPIEVTFNDTDNKTMTVQYQLNNDTTWTDLIVDKNKGTHNATIDYTTNYTTETQYIRFRVLSDVLGLGTKYSDISGDYSFTLKSNVPVLTISSTYEIEGYNTAINSTNYVSEINLEGTLKDIDLGDVVNLKYTLDGTFIEEKTFSNGIDDLDFEYKFVVDISNLNENDKHTLVVTATDLYKNTISKTITFKTYINNTATFKDLVVESINHKDTHLVPIKFEIFDKESDKVTVEYNLRSEDEEFGSEWTKLLENGENKKYTQYLDYTTNYTQKKQFIKFRLYDGITYSNETVEYSFVLTSNKPVITIKSDYSEDTYNTAVESTNYVGEIPFNLNLADLDLGDTLDFKYTLDGEEIDAFKVNNLTNSIDKDFNFIIDISNCDAGKHTLVATAVDNYKNLVSASIDFITYINYSPVVEHVNITDINHSETHLVPIDIKISDKDNDRMLIEYSLNDGDWQTLLSNKLTGTHSRYLDYTNDYTLGKQKIQFRLHDGTTYSNLSQIYNFTITSNNSVINIISNYNENGYNTSTLSTNLTTKIPLKISVTDDDLGDLVKIKYYLDDKFIEGVDLTNGVGIKVNKTHEFMVDISALTPGNHTLKVVGEDRYGNIATTTKDFLTYSNDRIQIKNFNVNIEERFNGAIYINEDNKQDASINFTLVDNDDNNLQYFIDVDYDFDGVEFKNTRRFASNVITKSMTDKFVSLNLHELLGDTDVSGPVRFRISANDTRSNIAQRQYYEVSIVSDIYSKVIKLTRNTSPKIINFNLPSNNFTLKNIYDVFMTNQTEKPTFTWIADAGTTDIYKNYEYGDEIISYQILYSVDNWNTSGVVATNITPTKNSLSWMNNTGYDNTKVQFKLIATDYFGASSEKILDDSYNYFLQVNNAPRAPLSLTIRNLNQSNISYGETYTFDWGISSEPDTTDGIVQYVFGYKLGSTIDNYNEMIEVYRGTSNSHPNWKNIAKESITFGVYSIDKFGVYSEIKTLTTSSIQNNKPNVVTSYEVKDLSFDSINKGYIKKNETYILTWEDAGDPDAIYGDAVQSWKVLYNINNGDWTELYTTRTSINLTIKDNGTNLEDKVNFKIVALDKFNESSESAVFTYVYVDDLTGPNWVNSNKFKSEEASRNGQKVHFEIADNGGVSKVEVYNGSILLGTLYDEMLASNPLVTSITDIGVHISDFNISKNGTYTLRLTDKYKNISSYSFTINEIDTVAPVVGILPDKNNNTLTNTDVTLTINATDDTFLSKIEIIDSIKGVQTFLTSNKTYSTKYIVSENSTITVNVTDKSGNTSSEKYTITNINKRTPIITNNYDNSNYADLETSFKVVADLGRESTTSLGSWTIISTGNYTYQTLNTSETEINITVQKNQTIKVKFTDIWGNESNELTINVDNIVDGIVVSDLMYLTTMTDFLKSNPGFTESEVEEDRDVYTLTSAKYTNNLPMKFVRLIPSEAVLYPAYAYIVIADSHKDISIVENKTSNPHVDILSHHEALFKFTEDNKTITFYLKDIFNHYTINRLNVSKIAGDLKTSITYEQDIESITNKSVNVLFKVNFGYFEDNASLYQYVENNVVKSYYDDFIWVDELKETDIYNGPVYVFKDVKYKEIERPTDVSNRTSFIYTFDKNSTFKVWAVDTNDGWLSKIAYITNIDKKAPSIVVDTYNNVAPNIITIVAHTTDSFYTASELTEDSFYDEFDLNQYTVSEDKKTATMTFTSSNNLFKFKAYDKAGNESYSEVINVDVYVPDTEYSIELIDSATGVSRIILIDELNNLRTNKDISLYINIISENGIFIEDLNNDYQYINEKRLKMTLTADGVYNFYSKDLNNNDDVYTVEVKNVINKTAPDVIVNTIKNNDGKYVASVDITATSDRIVSYKLFTDTEVISEIVEKKATHTFNVLSNGIYHIEAMDIYGNISKRTIEITGIFMKQDQPRIYVSQYTLNPTKYDINITFTVENGKFADWSNEDFVSINEESTLITYLVKDNKTINVSAVNYYDHERLGDSELETLTSLISSNVTISNIDKIAPFKPSYTTYLDNNGLIVFKFIDNGDIGFGTTGFKYLISSGKYNDSKDVSKDKIVGINQYDALYEDDNYILNLYAFDKAGNISEVEEFEFYSNNKIVNNFMTTYNAAIENLLNNDLTEEEKVLYLLEADYTEANLGVLVNIDQKEFLASKINDFRTFLGQVEAEERALIKEIDAYFNRLKLNFRDNSFMSELLVKINLVKNTNIQEDYLNLYDYYDNLIKNTFIDETSTEFNYIDANGNNLNPLSGYILNSDGVYGYYNSEGNFIEGKNNQLYYYNSKGELIQLDYYKKTYVDGNKNIINVENGLVNASSYYDSDGMLIDFKKYLNGFYDFQGIWHNRGSEIPVLNPDFIEDTEEPIPTPTPTPNPDDDKNPTPTPTPGDDKDPTPTPTPTPTPGPGGEEPTPTPDPDKILPSSITVSTTYLELLVGKSALVTTTILPKNATDKTVTWSSNNTAVATVDSTGMISAIAEGTAIITVKTTNNHSATLTVQVSKKSSVVDVTEKVNKVPSVKDYPTIEDIMNNNNNNDNNNSYKLPSYNKTKLGNINCATVLINNLTSENYLALENLGYSTVLYNGFTNLKTDNASKANVSIGMGNDKFKAIMSSKDIAKDGKVKEFKVSHSGNKFTLEVIGAESLGRNSTIHIYSTDKNKLVYYNDRVIKTTYDANIGAYIISNPSSGTYNIGDKQVSGYKLLDEYDLVNNNISKKEDITYTNIIVMAYNALKEDDFKELYSNIEVNSDIYREISILQRHGILGSKIAFKNTDNISGKDAFDIIYLTLSNLTSETLNYDNSDFINLDKISLSDINNMVKVITNK